MYQTLNSGHQTPARHQTADTGNGRRRKAWVGGEQEGGDGVGEGGWRSKDKAGWVWRTRGRRWSRRR